MVIWPSRAFHAKLALGTQEWLKRAARGQMDVREPVCQALELNMSITLAASSCLAWLFWA
jgi:hypothetical protein